jgi:hypothetical protein
MSDKKIMCEPIGIATTVGQLREMLKDCPDDMGFGFLNQPMQELYKFDSGGITAVVFQPVEDVLDGIGKVSVIVGYQCKLCGTKGDFMDFPVYKYCTEFGKEMDIFCVNPNCDGQNEDLTEITE